MVLLVEDDFDVRTGVATYLGERNVHVTPVETMAGAVDLLNRHRFDAVLLDLNLGSDDGLTLARHIGLHGTTPLLIISARGAESDRIIGLELGADDYLAKPFGFGELYARLRTVWRRTEDRGIRRRARARFSQWSADLAGHSIRNRQGDITRLTAGEAALLRAFLEHPGVALSRADLLRLTDHNDIEVFDRVVDVLVARLRRKLERGIAGVALIETVRGHGYRFDATVTWEDAAAGDTQPA